MKKNGIIPPHFIYFLENEGLILSDYRSGNLSMKDSYDRAMVSFPYSVITLNIQMIFDYLDYSAPPDFIITNSENFYIDYNSIISSWNFKDSSSLYNAICKVKAAYSKEQERVLFEQLDSNQYNDKIRKIVTNLKIKFNKYKNKDETYVDILYNYRKDEMVYTVISFPLDILIRSRSVNRYPVANVMIPVNFDNFFITIPIPDHIAGYENKLEEYSIKDFDDVVGKLEKGLAAHFRSMRVRENILNKINTSNLGFPLEIDTFNFNSCSIYFHYNKGSTNLNANKSLKGKFSSNVVATAYSGGDNSSTSINNFILQFLFKGSKLEFQIVDCDKLTILSKEQFDYGEGDTNGLIQNILQCLLAYIKNKK
jgi:hypothetical protein